MTTPNRPSPTMAERLTAEDVASLRALLEKATPGDWRVLHDGEDRTRRAVIGGVEVAVKKIPCECGQVWAEDADWPMAYCDTQELGEGPSAEVRMANARLIAALKNALPALLDAAEELATLKAVLALDDIGRRRLRELPDAECVSDDDEWDGSPFLGLGWIAKVGEKTYGRRACTVWKITDVGKVARQALGDLP